MNRHDIAISLSITYCKRNDSLHIAYEESKTEKKCDHRRTPGGVFVFACAGWAESRDLNCARLAPAAINYSMLASIRLSRNRGI